MDDESAVSSGDRRSWVWTPNVGYGPFNFGAALEDLPFLTDIAATYDMGADGIAFDYRTQFADIEVSVWNNALIDVSILGSFDIQEEQVIGRLFVEVDLLLPLQAEIDPFHGHFAANYDALGLTIMCDSDGKVTSVVVGGDPDKIVPPPSPVTDPAEL